MKGGIRLLDRRGVSLLWHSEGKYANHEYWFDFPALLGGSFFQWTGCKDRSHGSFDCLTPLRIPILAKAGSCGYNESHVLQETASATS